MYKIIIPQGKTTDPKSCLKELKKFPRLNDLTKSYRDVSLNLTARLEFGIEERSNAE